jgi:hypothetical protein
VLAEYELQRLDESYFPAVLFERSRSLIHASPQRLTVRPAPPPDYVQSFGDFARALLGTLEGGRYLRNLFVLKWTLSRFMLLPALYVQAAQGRPADKKNSFETARGLAPTVPWTTMDKVSGIRSGWPPAAALPRRRLLEQLYWLHPRLARPLYPPVPPALKSMLRDDLGGEMAIFVKALMRRS